MRTPHRTRLVFVLLLAALAAGPAAAGEIAAFGGPGGGPFRSECPPWSYVVGLAGGVGEWLDSIEPLCAPIQPAEQRIGPGTPNGHRYGGGGGGPFTVACPVGYALGGWRFDMVVNSDMDPTFVNGIVLDCRLLGSPGQTYTAQIGDYGAVLTKDVAVIAQMGWDRPADAQACPPHELVTGIHGRYGAHVDALGLICGAPPTAQDYAQCTGYRDAAVQAAADNQSLGCNQGGDRWSPDAALHMNWCLGLGAQRGAATQAEAAARAQALESCRIANLGVKERATGDVMAEPQVAVRRRGPTTSAVVAQPQPAPVVVGPPQPEVAVAQPGVAVRRSAGVIAAAQAPQAPVKGPLGPRFASPAPPSSDWNGVWATRTDKNWTYEITFSQVGSQVSGTYVVQNGDTGRIRGTLRDDVLHFEWDQDGGYTGTGQFTLGPDGSSFTGTYKTSPHPSMTDPASLTGTWSGTRK
jgi:hypothetical protein